MEEELQLSSHALQALHEFIKEKQELEAKFNTLNEPTMEDIQEDWQLSQFWYTPETCSILANEAIKETLENQSIGFISSPSAFAELKSLDPKRQLHLFEFDKRFGKYQEFIFYDYNEPLQVPELALDFVIVDPPFLSQECWTRVSQTVRKVLKENGKILVCTGMVMQELILKELNCKPTGFEPRHKNGLSNEFGSFANYNSSLNASISG